MGLILDSSVIIAAERRGDTVEKLIEQVVSAAGDQDAALFSKTGNQVLGLEVCHLRLPVLFRGQERLNYWINLEQ
jgi:hypothetical protein